MKSIKIIFTAFVIVTGVISLTSFTQQKEMKDWEAPKSADSLINPFKGNDAATLKGKSLFDKQCALCHGSKGTGNGFSAADFEIRPTDLTSKMAQAHTDGALYWKIMHGNSPMPSFKKAHKTNHNQCWQVINYIRELGKSSVK